MLKTHIIIPCYNESDRLPRQELVDFIEASPWASVGLVNDGSADDTIAVLRELQREHPDRIDVHDLAQNVGKAEAVRRGVLDSRHREYDLVGYLDADFATPPRTLEAMVPAFGAQHKVVVGSRVRRAGANIERSVFRHYLGRSFATVATLTLGVSLYDTQCGAKLFARDVAFELFSEPFLTRWLFDLELLMRLKALVGPDAFSEMIYEYPLSEWIEKGDSRLRPKDLITVPYDLMRLRRAYRR